MPLQDAVSSNPFLFIKSKTTIFIFRVFLHLWKNAVTYSQRECCPSSRTWQPSPDSNGHLAHFFKFELAGPALQPSADSNGRLAGFKFEQKCAKWPLLSAEGWTTLPDHSAELFAEGRRALKSSKGTLRPDFQLQGNPGIVSWRQFWVNDVWTLLGQESPLMNKRGLKTSKNYSHRHSRCPGSHSSHRPGWPPCPQHCPALHRPAPGHCCSPYLDKGAQLENLWSTMYIFLLEMKQG